MTPPSLFGPMTLIQHFFLAVFHSELTYREDFTMLCLVPRGRDAAPEVPSLPAAGVAGGLPAHLHHRAAPAGPARQGGPPGLLL